MMDDKGRLSKIEALEMGKRPFNLTFLLIVLFYVGFVLLITFGAIARDEQFTRQEAGNSLETVLETSNEVLALWLKQQQERVLREAKDPDIVEATQLLLAAHREQETLLAHPALVDLRTHIQPLLEQTGDLGIFVIAPDNISVASMRDANIGTTNLIAEQRPDLLARVFQGEVLLIPPIRSDVLLLDDSGDSLRQNLPTMFIAGPIRNEANQIIAVLTVRIDPSADFSRITQLGQLGSSGETYAFDQSGIMMTDSRFTDQLAAIGLLDEGERSINRIRITDPGGNLLEGYDSVLPAAGFPLTSMASSALSGNRGVNTAGYRDYRGVPVFGAWIWDETLGMGLASEIDVDEALSPYYKTRNNFFSLVGATLSVSLLLAVNMFYIRWRRDRDLQIAYLALHKSEQQNRAILENVLDAIISINEAGIITSFNSAAEQVFGYAAAEVLGKNINRLMPEPDHSQHDGYLENYYHDGIPKIVGIGREVTGLRKDGSQFPMYLGVNELVIGQERSFTGVIRDITIQRQAEQAMQEARASAEAASLMKSEFLSNVNHELRTPLNWLMGVVYRAELSEMSPDQVELLTKLKSVTKSLKTVIDSILDFRALREGDLELIDAPFNLHDLMAQLGRECAVKVEEKGGGITAVYHTAPDIPATLLGDENRLKQVLTYLTDNAIKFTEKGRIEVSAKLVQKDDTAATLMFIIRDTGIGMTEEDVQQLFQPFTQLDSSSTRKYGGLGMGLILGKRIVEQMGGEIYVKSKYGEGSLFYFTIKLIIVFTDDCIIKSRSETLKEELVPQTEEPPPLVLGEILPIIQELAYHLEEDDTQALHIMEELRNKIALPQFQPDLKQLEGLIKRYEFEDAHRKLTHLAVEIGIMVENENMEGEYDQETA